MDHPDPPTSPTKSSTGIPRFSKLPTLKSAIPASLPPSGQVAKSGLPYPAKSAFAIPTAKQALPKPKAPTANKRASVIGTPSRLPPPKTSTHRATQSVSTSNNASSVYGRRPESRPGSRLARPTPAKHLPSQHQSSYLEDTDDGLGSLGGFRSSSRQSSRAGSSLSHHAEETPTQTTPKGRKIARQSLSDRTIDSISRLPPTPATDRRRSSFFAPPSPMGPPSRPASAMSNGLRPGSSDGFAKPTAQLMSPTKRVPASARPGSRMSIDYASSKSTPSKRSVSTGVPRSVQSKPASAQQSAIGRPSSSRLPNPATGSRIPGTPGAGASAIAHPSTAIRNATAKRVTAPVASVAGRPRAESPTPLARPAAATKAPTSSSALRDQIAKAKAAAKAAATAKANVAQHNGNEDLEFDLAIDPFNARPKDNKGLLLKRIDAARADGRLNIAAMGLKQIPDEVLRMYDAEEMTKSKLTWSETVDLTRLVAADNEFEIISDEIFPDIDNEAAAEQDEDSSKGLQFRGLESLDLHGNMLIAIPVGLRRLERLTVVNLSHNKLNNTAWDVLSQLETLEELRLGHNNLTAYLPQGLSRLRNLRTLDLQSNKLLSLPEGLRDLVNLRVLNVSHNQLTGIPMDALESLPLIELSVANNAMVGALFGFSVGGMSHLESLDVSNNSLASLAFSESLALPALKTLNIANNRIVALPDVTGWTELASIAAGDNKVSGLPTGFTSLQSLRHADFTGNDLAKLPNEVGLMGSLDTLNIASNPIRERRLLNMNTEQLKRDLRSRIGPDRRQPSEEDFEDEGIDIQSPGSTEQAWKLSSGHLNLADKDLVNEDADELRSFLGTNNDVRELVLAKNNFTMIPFEISLAQHLKVLDISKCSLERDYLMEVVNFQFLKELNISGNKITSLDPLLDMFLAPRLEVLDISNNRLVGSVPALKGNYPELKELHARDNRLDAVSAEALAGLHSVDLCNNNIGLIPPRIGLLWEQGLRGLSISGNTFRVPQHRILEKGTEAILAHLREKIPVEDVGEEETF
ncbi:hypothetical protein AAFC00_003197 [Neodothiora populina]|uniref:L domain-like protein n=1 Tax=Neodothiora populina TaxID=2781224 RepID=A0ABR3PA12_9PEZI